MIADLRAMRYDGEGFIHLQFHKPGSNRNRGGEVPRNRQTDAWQ